MTRLRPSIEYALPCPRCGTDLVHGGVIWQGVHVCADSVCERCGGAFICDLPHGQANVTPYLLDRAANSVVGMVPPEEAWFAEILQRVNTSPQGDTFGFGVEIVKRCRRVTVLNTLDFLFGHAAPELFNALRHLDRDPGRGLVVIIQPFLRWLVPDGVAEVWTVDLPMGRAREYFPSISDSVNRELQRFDEVFLSRADVQPSGFEISRFTRVPVHDFSRPDYRITFIWREDRYRLWCRRTLATRILRRASLAHYLVWLQAHKVTSLFGMLRARLPAAQFTVAGLGRTGRFPTWIEDRRISHFDQQTERALCALYGESRVVIGVHGSSMILPSAHAGMAVSLMPEKRWGNFAQDLLFDENDDRLSIFQKRILPIRLGLEEIADICENMVSFREGYLKRMVDPFVANGSGRR